MKKITLFIYLLCFTAIGNTQELLLLKSNGKVVIGDTTQFATPGEYGLYVEHGILTERVKVALKSSNEWSDDAWSDRPDLQLMKKHIENKKHLYGMPSVAKLMEEGYELKNMDSKLLAQIEWLWMYILELESKNTKLEDRLKKIEQTISKTPK